MPSRRQTVATLAGVLSAHVVSAQTDESYSSGALGAAPYSTFVSTNATPPLWNHVLPINDTIKPQLTSGLIFIGPRGTATHQAAPYIYNQTGELVWDGSLDGYTQTMAYSVQQYRNKSVLAIWQGQFNAGGYGSGYNLLLNETYQVVGNVTTDNLAGIGADIHEFKITSNNTALLTAYNATQLDLTSYEGSADGYILTSMYQEIDIATGASLFTWNSLDHVDPNECYVSPGSSGTQSLPWDYFHINSVDKDSKGNYLVSSRHCHTAYYIDGTNGAIMWKLGGKNSSFTGEGSEFYFQHDARFHANDTQVSIFDNGATSWETSEATARGLLIDLNYSNMTATLAAVAIPYYNLTVAESQGNVQIQENGNMMIGWGQNPWLGEHNSEGTPLWAAQFGVGDVQSYRAHRSIWNGYPTTLPSFVIQSNGSTTGYASWNGATEMAVWELLGSNDASAVVSLANTSAVGIFETNFTIPSSPSYSYYQVRALDSREFSLGYSNFISSSNDTVLPPAATQKPAVGAANATTVASSASSQATGSSSASTSGAGTTKRASLLVTISAVITACLCAS
ncbi:hypothetical protein QFC22_004115 [Naganishia vaughanmartiniae]|uniref:Uncharacterized protein n=1 Tax=Naganishia vaughanmartiniae TaxID=1424756 RepID=A0ACC2X2D6_9TREE|nr:hypothetical protein QFC22_004115 [Naganishia vaughanmartiniae]